MENTRNPAPEVIKQIFMGNDDFVDAARRKGKSPLVYYGRFSFQQVVEAVCGAIRTDREEIRQPKRNEKVQRGREMLCYIARRYGEVGLPELARFLQVKELSTASHTVRRAKERLKEDSAFRRQADQALKQLHSSMQA